MTKEEHKYKPGDFVRVLTEGFYSNAFTVGNKYKVADYIDERGADIFCDNPCNPTGLYMFNSEIEPWTETTTPDNLDLNHFLDEVAREYHLKDYQEIKDKIDPHVTDFNRVQYLMITLEAHKRFHAYQLDQYKTAFSNHDYLRDLEKQELSKELAEAREQIRQLKSNFLNEYTKGFKAGLEAYKHE